MTIEEAILVLNEIANSVIRIDWLDDALEIAIEALREKNDKQKNGPISLKELHEMMDVDSPEPLWIFLKETNSTFPAIIDRVDGEIIAIMGADPCECIFYEKDYGKTWLMYHEKRT